MSKHLTLIAIALGCAAVPAALAAQDRPPAYFGAAGFEDKHRVTVAEIMPGSTADVIGLRPGDVVTHAGGKRITAEGKMRAWVRSLKVGDPVELTIRRSGDVLQLKGVAMAR